MEYVPMALAAGGAMMLGPTAITSAAVSSATQIATQMGTKAAITAGQNIYDQFADASPLEALVMANAGYQGSVVGAKLGNEIVKTFKAHDIYGLQMLSETLGSTTGATALGLASSYGAQRFVRGVNNRFQQAFPISGYGKPALQERPAAQSSGLNWSLSNRNTFYQERLDASVQAGGSMLDRMKNKGQQAIRHAGTLLAVGALSASAFTALQTLVDDTINMHIQEVNKIDQLDQKAEHLVSLWEATHNQVFSKYDLKNEGVKSFLRGDNWEKKTTEDYDMSVPKTQQYMDVMDLRDERMRLSSEQTWDYLQRIGAQVVASYLATGATSTVPYLMQAAYSFPFTIGQSLIGLSTAAYANYPLATLGLVGAGVGYGIYKAFTPVTNYLKKVFGYAPYSIPTESEARVSDEHRRQTRLRDMGIPQTGHLYNAHLAGAPSFEEMYKGKSTGDPIVDKITQLLGGSAFQQASVPNLDQMVKGLQQMKTNMTDKIEGLQRLRQRNQQIQTGIITQGEAELSAIQLAINGIQQRLGHTTVDRVLRDVRLHTRQRAKLLTTTLAMQEGLIKQYTGSERIVQLDQLDTHLDKLERQIAREIEIDAELNAPSLYEGVAELFAEARTQSLATNIKNVSRAAAYGGYSLAWILQSAGAVKNGLAIAAMIFMAKQLQIPLPQLTHDGEGQALTFAQSVSKYQSLHDQLSTQTQFSELLDPGEQSRRPFNKLALEFGDKSNYIDTMDALTESYFKNFVANEAQTLKVFHGGQLQLLAPFLYENSSLGGGSDYISISLPERMSAGTKYQSLSRIHLPHSKVGFMEALAFVQQELQHDLSMQSPYDVSKNSQGMDYEEEKDYRMSSLAADNMNQLSGGESLLHAAFGAANQPVPTQQNFNINNMGARSQQNALRGNVQNTRYQSIASHLAQDLQSLYRSQQLFDLQATASANEFHVADKMYSKNKRSDNSFRVRATTQAKSIFQSHKLDTLTIELENAETLLDEALGLPSKQIAASFSNFCYNNILHQISAGAGVIEMDEFSKSAHRKFGQLIKQLKAATIKAADGQAEASSATGSPQTFIESLLDQLQTPANANMNQTQAVAQNVQAIQDGLGGMNAVTDQNAMLTDDTLAASQQQPLQQVVSQDNANTNTIQEEQLNTAETQSIPEATLADFSATFKGQAPTTSTQVPRYDLPNYRNPFTGETRAEELITKQRLMEQNTKKMLARQQAKAGWTFGDPPPQR